jgi:hypothetical protein
MGPIAPLGSNCAKGASSGTVTPPAKVTGMPSRGTSSATVLTQFPTVYLYVVTNNPAYDAQFAMLDDYMLAGISQEYIRHGGNVAALMKQFALKLSAANLLRAQSAFGVSVVTPAVELYSAAAVKTTYNAGGTRVVIHLSSAQSQTMGIGNFFPPTFSMTQTDLFYEFFAVRGATVASALVSAAAFEAVVLKQTFDVSYWVGGKLYIILDHLDPNINIEIGDIIGATVDDVVDFVSTPTGTGYVDLPTDADGNWIFPPDAPAPDFNWNYDDWGVCLGLGQC